VVSGVATTRSEHYNDEKDKDSFEGHDAPLDFLNDCSSQYKKTGPARKCTGPEKIEETGSV
jgi:hypothetical protein